MKRNLADIALYGRDGFGLNFFPSAKSMLHHEFVFPPFSVWDAKSKDWQARKRRWVSLGIQSELGRDAKVYASSNQTIIDLGVISIFDPVVCELCYSWFCPRGGQIVDPFAGGSVRGVVASVLGHHYWGCDLSKKQVDANRDQLTERMIGKHPPVWECGDGFDLLRCAPTCDLLFSCPPYGNLEKYSEDPLDISTMGYEDFSLRYFQIIRRACRKLKNNRFACFVVCNFRDKKTGLLYDLVGDTIRHFRKCGLGLYNEVVLATSLSSAPLRARRIFNGGKKLVRTHQNVLVFSKGNPQNGW